MTPPVIAHAWDPFHGDSNNRHPRLGAPTKRVVPREQWTDFRHTQPAIFNNGIFADFERTPLTTPEDRREKLFHRLFTSSRGTA